MYEQLFYALLALITAALTWYAKRSKKKKAGPVTEGEYETAIAKGDNKTVAIHDREQLDKLQRLVREAERKRKRRDLDRRKGEHLPGDRNGPR